MYNHDIPHMHYHDVSLPW